MGGMSTAAPPVAPAPAVRPVHGVVASDGVPLHVEIRGRSGPVVVLSHGFTVDSGEWDRQVAALAGRARVVTWDQRGHGRSGWGDPARATVEQLADDLVTVLGAVAPRERVVLGGHSMGGMTILALAHARPGLFGTRVGGVLLVATSAGELLHEGLVGLLHRGTRRLGLLPAVLTVASVAAPVADRLPWRGSRFGRWFLRRLLFTPATDDTEVRQAQHVTESLPLSVGAAFSRAMLDLDETDGLPALRRVPTTVVVAEDDRLTPAAHGERIADALGENGRIVRVPAAAHAVPQTHPEPVDAALAELVERLRGSHRRGAGPGQPASTATTSSPSSSRTA